MKKNVCYCCKKSILLLHNYENFGDHFDLSVRCHDRSLCQFPKKYFLSVWTGENRKQKSTRVLEV